MTYLGMEKKMNMREARTREEKRGIRLRFLRNSKRVLRVSMHLELSRVVMKRLIPVRP
jgi:hypothetical protein